METTTFLDLFRQALNNINNGYYDRTEWNAVTIEKINSTEPSLWKEIPAKYGERVFCYELYHQVRLLMDEYIRDHPQDVPLIRFQAELKKPQIEATVAAIKEVQALDKEYFPDFLLHAPDPLNFDYQKLIIEVKSGPRLSFSDIHEDLAKIQQFITRYKFEQGLFLAINTPIEYILEVLAKRENQAWIHRNLPNRSQIIVMAKEKRGKPLFETIPDGTYVS